MKEFHESMKSEETIQLGNMNDWLDNYHAKKRPTRYCHDL